MLHPFAGVAQPDPTTTPAWRSIVGGLLSSFAGRPGRLRIAGLFSQWKSTGGQQPFHPLVGSHGREDKIDYPGTNAGLAFSADSKRLAVSGCRLTNNQYKSPVVIWDVTTGKHHALARASEVDTALRGRDRADIPASAGGHAFAVEHFSTEAIRVVEQVRLGWKLPSPAS